MLVFASLLVATSFAWCTNTGEPIDARSALEALCKNAPVAITKLSDIQAIVEQLKSGTAFDGCSEQVKDAILDLEPVIDDADDVCSMKKVDQIRVYHLRYIQSHVTNGRAEAGVSIPQSLRNFFIGFGLKVNKICKTTMINNLIYDTRELLTPEDFEQLALWTKNEERFVLQSSNGPADYDDLLLAGDLIRLTETRDSSSNEKIFIQTGASQLLNKIRSVCRRRFKPFYEKLIVPVVSLSNLGYNYQGEELERELREMKSNKEVHQWYEVVYLCQALDDTELVESDEDREKTGGLDRKLVKILTREEAEALKGDDKPADDDDDALEQIIYKPEGGNPISDVILDDDDRNLNRLIKGFDSNKSDLDRIRSKLFWKMGSFLKENLIGGNFKIIFSTLFRNREEKQQVDGENESKNPRAEIVKAFDEYVQQLTRSSGNDQPVAGFSDYGRRAYHNAAYLGPSGIAHKAAEKTIQPFNYGLTFWRLIAVILMIAAVGITLSSVL